MEENKALPVTEEKELSREGESPEAEEQEAAGRGSFEEEGANRILMDWQRQGRELKALYPDFELEKEAADPRFLRLLRAGAGIREAYEYSHREELLKENLRSIALEVRKRVLRDVAARGMERPRENGVSGRVAALVRESGPADWDRATRDRIGREALRGKKYSIKQ